MHVVIIGNGITGITAARTIRKRSDCHISVISSESKYFYSRTALMYIYMGHMKFEHTKPYEDFFWQENKIDLIHDHVTSIDFNQKLISLRSQTNIKYDELLIATGSKSNLHNWHGKDLKGVQGLYSLQDLELLEKNTHPPKTPISKMKVKRAIVVGGGLIGVELAEMLVSRNIEVTMVIRESRYWGNVLPQEESNLVMNHLIQHGVKIKLNSEISEIIPDELGSVKYVTLKSGERLECQFVGLTMGVTPNIDFVANSELKTNKGILVDAQLRTNIKHVFAAGDCAEFKSQIEGRGFIEQVWYTGRMMGEVAGQNILGAEKSYDPGPWFNSAKFFDVEYQAYGHVASEPETECNAFFWQDRTESKCLRIVANKETNQLRGVNAFGIRLRHKLMDQWLRSEKTLDFFIENFNKVLFDPEFSKDELPAITEAYNRTFNKSIKVEKKRWFKALSI